HDPPACNLDHTLPGGCIPLAGRSKARIDVCPPFGHSAELERAAGRNHRVRSVQLLKPGLEVFAPMRATANDAQRLVGDGTSYIQTTATVAVFSPGTQTLSGKIQCSQ